MKKITVKKISMVNFKGVRSLEMEFGKGVSEVRGRNATGKTTVYDAFVWCLFGKDGKGREKFSLKTLDGEGREIPRIPHEVTVSLEVEDGGRAEDVVLTRQFNDKWVKRRGQQEEVYDGMEGKCLWNGVPVADGEYRQRVDALCPWETFMSITSVTHFTSKKPDEQRRMLFQMAGGMTDREVVSGDPVLEGLLERMGGKSMEDYAKETAARKRKVKTETQDIPGRIDERKRDMARLEETDYEAVAAEIDRKQERIAGISRQMADKGEAARAQAESRAAAQRELSALRDRLYAVQERIRKSAMEDYGRKTAEQSRMRAEVKSLLDRAASAERDAEMYRQDLERKRKSLDESRAEWMEENSREFVFDENMEVCPTCGRRLEEDTIAQRRQAMEDTFNARKADRLRDIAGKGTSIKKAIAATEETISTLLAEAEERRAQAAKTEGEPLYGEQLVKPDVQAACEADAEWRGLSLEVEEAGRRLEDTPAAQRADTSQLETERRETQAEVSRLQALLSGRDELERNRRRVAELETLYRDGQAEVARLEGEEDAIKAFGRRKVELTEGKVNAMFSLVRFRMYNYKVDGTAVETCEAQVDGVPYSAQNSAMRINMGLDIINAISRSTGVSAPVFIDNAESCLGLAATESQLIRLTVADEELNCIQGQ